MDIIMSTVFDTDWGLVIVGALIFIALIWDFFRQKPKT